MRGEEDYSGVHTRNSVSQEKMTHSLLTAGLFGGNRPNRLSVIMRGAAGVRFLGEIP